MESPYRVAGKMASPGLAQRIAWVVWGICVSLILAATVIGTLDGKAPWRFATTIRSGVAFGLFGTVGALIVDHRTRNPIGWIPCPPVIRSPITDLTWSYPAY